MYCLFLVDLIFVAAMLSFVKGYPIETAIMDSNKKASGIMSAAPTSTHLKSLIKFLQRSPSTFHAVEESCQYLLSQGFKALDESTIWHFGFQDIEIDSTEDSWIVPGGKYFLKRQGSSLLAFTVGKNFNPALGLSGDSSNYFKIIAAHTDSPCLKVRRLFLDSMINYFLGTSESEKSQGRL